MKSGVFISCAKKDRSGLRRGLRKSCVVTSVGHGYSMSTGSSKCDVRLGWEPMGDLQLRERSNHLCITCGWLSDSHDLTLG